MAVISISVPNLVLKYDINAPHGEYYVNQIDPEMRKWLCEKIGEPYFWNFKNWNIERNIGSDSEAYPYRFNLDTTENIAVEFKLRWL